MLLEGFAAQVFCCSRALLLKAFDAQASRALLLKVFVAQGPVAQFHGVSLVMIIMVMSHSLTLLVRDILNTETANDVISSSVPFCFWINQNFAVIIPVKACLLGTWSEKKRDYVGKIPNGGEGSDPNPLHIFLCFF